MNWHIKYRSIKRKGSPINKQFSDVSHSSWKVKVWKKNIFPLTTCTIVKCGWQPNVRNKSYFIAGMMQANRYQHKRFYLLFPPPLLPPPHPPLPLLPLPPPPPPPLLQSKHVELVSNELILICAWKKSLLYIYWH